MPLIRETRASGNSVVVTIPSQLVESYDINMGDTIKIIPLKNGEIRIKKINLRYKINGGSTVDID